MVEVEDNVVEGCIGVCLYFFFFQAEDGIRDKLMTGVQTCALPISLGAERGFHIASLDGIRAVAAMIVFLGHAGLQSIVPGGFGVTVFFFLSGFLITTLLRREYEQIGRASCRERV